MSDFLPEAILIKIFIKLPVKSIIRATSVCKPWWSLIRSPYFISLHHSITENQTLVRYHDLDDQDGREHYIVTPKGGPFAINSSPELELPFKCPTSYFAIVGSCDGLVCLFNGDELAKPSGPIMIWNPAIRHHVVLPQPNLNKYERLVLGFGVSRNVYKVVSLFYCGKTHLVRVEILSLGTGKWRKICLPKFDCMVCGPRFIRRPGSVFFKGFMHWSTSEAITGRNLILTFHVGDEAFGEMVLSEELERNDEGVMPLSLDVMGESLVAVKYVWERSCQVCDVWRMNDYGVKESWTKLYRIDSVRFPKVSGFLGSDEVLLPAYDDELVTYNPETKGIKHLEVFGYPLSLYVNASRFLIRLCEVV